MGFVLDALSMGRLLVISLLLLMMLLSMRQTCSFVVKRSGRLDGFYQLSTRNRHRSIGWRQSVFSEPTNFKFPSTIIVAAATATTRTKSTTTSTAATEKPKKKSTKTEITKKKSTKTEITTNDPSSSSASSARPFRLVIVESPAKCKTISKILNDYAEQEKLPYDFVVAACFGHIRNLSKRRLFSDNNDSDKNQSKSPIVGVDVNNGYAPDYMLLPEKKDVVRTLQPLAEQAEQIILATDDDREGEAIAWHLCQVLLDDSSSSSSSSKPSTKKKKPAEKKLLQRVTFTEITPNAIRDAFSITTSSSNEQQEPYASDDFASVLNMNLVEAQETRRIVDRLAGFTMSPLLWKKIAPGLSAGRVQSVGLALVVQRERQRLAHIATDYSTLFGTFAPTTNTIGNPETLEATLIKVNGQPVARASSDFESTTGLVVPQKMHLTDELAHDLISTLKHHELDKAATRWRVISVKSSPRTVSPPVPFKTSTLQQEAYGKLGLPVAQIMRLAQNLYEDGKISYMRTDSTQLSAEAHAAIEQTIESQHLTLDKASQHNSKKGKKDKASKFAQEAHEAIRPAIQPNGLFLTPQEVDNTMSSPAAEKLYRLIYQRTIASRMPPQRLNQTSIVIEGRTKNTTDGETADVVAEFRWSGSVVLDPGFTRIYDMTSNDDAANGPSISASSVPGLLEGQVLQCHNLVPESHITQPPPRYTEASLVKELEALGVGRPSTYASIVQILRDRAYVGSPQSSSSSSTFRYNKKKTPKGASLLARRAAGGDDSLSFSGSGRGPLIPSLTAFVVCSLLERYCPTYVDPSFTANMEERLDWIATGQNDQDRVKYLDEFYAGEQGLAAQVSRIEATVPASEARRALLPALVSPRASNNIDDDPEEVGLFVGPWGPYVQKLVVNVDDDVVALKLPSATLPASMAADLSTVTPQALKTLLSTRTTGGIVLGQHPDDGRNIRLKVGRFGAYLQWGEDDEESTTSHSLPKHIARISNWESSTPNEVDELYFSDEEGEGPTVKNGISGLTFQEAVGYVGLPRVVGVFNELPITASLGPYGPYLKYNNSCVSLRPDDGDVLTVDAEIAERLIVEGASKRFRGTNRGVISDLGEMDGANVTVKDGKFGKYISWKNINVMLPREYDENVSGLSIEEAWALVQKKSANPKTKKRVVAIKGVKGKKSVAGKKERAAKKPTRLLVSSAPKRAKSAYLYFCQEKRPEIANSFKGVGEVSKELGRLWRETSTEDRKIYEELAKADKGENTAEEEESVALT